MEAKVLRSGRLLRKAIELVAPGSPIREAIDSIVTAKTGALIYIGNFSKIKPIMDGGFRVDLPLRPELLYELSKMDGAIILSEDARRILFVNVHLHPDPKIPTEETGTRHRTAHRVSVQTGEIVISISQRRGRIALYVAGRKYVLGELPEVMAKAQQLLSAIESYKEEIRKIEESLNYEEVEGEVEIGKVLDVASLGIMLLRFSHELEWLLLELGREGSAIKARYYEVVNGVEDSLVYLFMDYSSKPVGREQASRTIKELRMLRKRLSVIREMVKERLGINGETAVPRGYRLLTKVVDFATAKKLVEELGNLKEIIDAKLEEIEAVLKSREEAEKVRKALHHLIESVHKESVYEGLGP